MLYALYAKRVQRKTNNKWLKARPPGVPEMKASECALSKVDLPDCDNI